jgi:DNA-binding FadR family transcriptional regulator
MSNHEPGDIDELKETYELMNRDLEDFQNFNLADLRFHTIIARGTKNPIVISIYEMITGILEASMNLSYGKIGSEVCAKFHADIIDAIERGDEEMATLLMKRHIEENIDHIKSNHAGEL